MTWNDWISLSGVVIALCALIATLHNMHSQRRREQIMLQPSLTPTVVTKLEGKIGVLSVGMINDGLGPAKILSFEPKVGGVAMELRELVDCCVGDRYHRKTKLTKPATSSSVSPGSIMTFVEIAFPANNQADVDEFADLFEAAIIDVNYQSFLGGNAKTITVGS